MMSSDGSPKRDLEDMVRQASSSGVIDANALSQLLDSHVERVCLVDCRFSLADVTAGAQAYQASHLPGAVFADLERDLSGPIASGKTGRHPLPDPLVLVQTFTAWGIDEHTLVVAYDDGSCMFAPRLWWLLRWLGHARVAVLRGGLPAWSAAGKPLSQLPPTRASAAFEPRLNAAMLAAVQEVEAAASGADRAAVLLDARAEERYRGEHEPIDPVAGHIPTAKNLPYTRLVDAGAPRSASDVKAAFESALNGDADQAIIAYCGSGVTACALIWASHAAGLAGIALYPGSWSEWVTDPSHPVARGAD